MMLDNVQVENKTQNIIAILWPSFIVSGVLTILLFSVFNPADVAACIGAWELSQLGYYSFGFFILWFFLIINSVLALYFIKPYLPKTSNK